MILIATVLGSWLKRVATLRQLLCTHTFLLQTALKDTSLLHATPPDTYLEHASAVPSACAQLYPRAAAATPGFDVGGPNICQACCTLHLHRSWFVIVTPVDPDACRPRQLVRIHLLLQNADV